MSESGQVAWALAPSRNLACLWMSESSQLERAPAPSRDLARLWMSESCQLVRAPAPSRDLAGSRRSGCGPPPCLAAGLASGAAAVGTGASTVVDTGVAMGMGAGAGVGSGACTDVRTGVGTGAAAAGVGTVDGFGSGFKASILVWSGFSAGPGLGFWAACMSSCESGQTRVSSTSMLATPVAWLGTDGVGCTFGAASDLLANSSKSTVAGLSRAFCTFDMSWNCICNARSCNASLIVSGFGAGALARIGGWLGGGPSCVAASSTESLHRAQRVSE